MLGYRVAHSEAVDRVDPGQRGEQHAYAGEIRAHGAYGISYFAHQRVADDSVVVLYGCGQPLSNIQVVGILGRRIRTTTGHGGKIGGFTLRILLLEISFDCRSVVDQLLGKCNQSI